MTKSQQCNKQKETVVISAKARNKIRASVSTILGVRMGQNDSSCLSIFYYHGYSPPPSEEWHKQ